MPRPNPALDDDGREELVDVEVAPLRGRRVERGLDYFEDHFAGHVVGLDPGPELKGSVGEGPNHSNFSDRSSVKILSKFKNFR